MSDTIYASRKDVEDRWRPLRPDEAAIIGALLADASLEVDVRCPPADSVDDADLRRIVVVRMIKRALPAMQAGGAITQQTNTAGPFGATQTYANPLGELYLTKADLRLLGCGRQQAFSISMWPEQEEGVDRWSYLSSPP